MEFSLKTRPASMNAFFGFLPNDIVNLHFYKTARAAWLIVTTKAIWNIIKKCAKKGKLDSGDVIRAGILVASELDKANKYNHKGKLKRKSFSQTIQEITIIKQANRCNMCNNSLMRLILITLMETDPTIQSQIAKLYAPTVTQKKLGRREKMEIKFQARKVT